MQLNNSQLGTLKAWLVTNAGSLNDQEAADALNQLANPAFIVWRTDMTAMEVNEAVDWDETVDLVAAAGLNTNQILTGLGKITALQLFKDQPTFNASKPSIRQAFASIYDQTAQPNSFAGLLAAAKRQATVGEKVLATGTGSDQNPGTMGNGAEGLVTVQNVVDALALPA